LTRIIFTLIFSTAAYLPGGEALHLFAQSDSTKHARFTFETGNEYTIKIKGGFEPTGIVIYQDSATIKLQTQYKIFDLRRDEITAVEGFETAESKMLMRKAAKDTTIECDIYMIDRSLYKNVNIIRSEDSVVVLLKENTRRNIDLYAINKIVFTESGLWRGVGIGAGIGFGLGFLTGMFALSTFSFEGTREFDFGRGLSFGFMTGVIMAIPSGVIGGFIGSLTGDKRTVYDMSGVNRELKLKRLRYIIEENRKGKY